MNHALIFSCNQVLHRRNPGSHRIATYLRSHGMDVEVIDHAMHWSLDELKELANSRINNNTLFIGFGTFFHVWNDTLEEFTKWLSEKYPNIPKILGGQSVLLTKANYIDYWIDSYGEVAILELAKSLSGNSSKILYDFEYFGRKKVIKALHSYPAYNLKNYRNKYEKRDYILENETLGMEFSRGCKFACDFCNFPILGVKEDTSRPPEDVREELVYNYNEFGVQNYFVADETFNDRKEKIIKYANVVDSLNFSPWFTGFIRGDLLVSSQRDIWDSFIKMRFGGQFYGIETFNRQAGKVIKKGMDPDKLKQGLLDFKSYLEPYNIYRGTISLIIGLPYETEQSWNSTLNWLVKNWSGQSVVAWYLEILDFDNEMTNVSEFTKNLKKYGIRKMINVPEDVKTAKISMSNKELYWEHDTMNIGQARQLLQVFEKNYQKKYFHGAWNTDVLFLSNNTKNIEDVVKIDHADYLDYNIKRLVKNYIGKKLS